MYREFFAYARERQSIFLKKSAGLDRVEWTNDPVLSHYKFCNVFREDDRTTIWLRENVREQIKGPDVLLATIVFRWFNRITTGEAIFTNRDSGGKSAFENFLRERSTEPLREAILEHCGSGPYVTGAYCIIGMPHMSKLDGVLACIQNVVNDACPSRIIQGRSQLWWGDLAMHLWSHPGEVSLEQVWDWFRFFPRSGDFMSYEIVTDLNHTRGMLDQAPDVMTWANPGPGAARGLNRIHERYIDAIRQKAQMNQEMLNILEASRLSEYWPQFHDGVAQFPDGMYMSIDRIGPDSWPAWDMRTVEHTLCEFDKYCRVHEGGKVKGTYR